MVSISIVPVTQKTVIGTSLIWPTEIKVGLGD